MFRKNIFIFFYVHAVKSSIDVFMNFFLFVSFLVLIIFSKYSIYICSLKLTLLEIPTLSLAFDTLHFIINQFLWKEKNISWTT